MKVNQQGKLIRCYGDCIVVSDFHIPEHDDSMIEDIIKAGMHYNTKSLIINGDIWDFIKFSKYGEGKNQDWKKLKEISKGIFSRLFEWFNQVVMNMGNHDAWLKYITRQQLTMEDFIELCIDQPPWVELYFTDWDFVILDDSIRICHSKNYSRNAHSVPEALGKKYRMSCAQSHDHMLAYKEVIINNVSKYYINMGCCLDYDKAEYEMGSSSLYGNWAKGFLVVRKGVPEVITKEPMVSERMYSDTVNGIKNGYIMRRWERSDR